MRNATNRKQPAYRLYSVMEKPGRRPEWTQIGAAWTHQDGQGLSISLSAQPLAGASLVLRTIDAKTDELPQTG
jgi:hypothetical protein